MRLVKLTDELLGGALDDYFDNVLPGRRPPGLFRCPRGRIAEDALAEGETLLFSYAGRLRFVARSLSTRLEHTFLPDDKYPHCFIVDLQSVRRANVPLDEVESKLREAHCLDKSFRSRGWTIIDDSSRAEQVINSLLTEG